METITCKTVACPMGDEKHYPHPDGIVVICCFCSQEMTSDVLDITKPVIEIIENE